MNAVVNAGAIPIPRWTQAYQAMVAALDAQAAQVSQQQMQLQNQLTQQSMALQQQQHDQFMAAQNARFAVHQQEMNVMNQAQASSVTQHFQNMARRDAIASDWVFSNSSRRMEKPAMPASTVTSVNTATVRWVMRFSCSCAASPLSR